MEPGDDDASLRLAPHAVLLRRSAAELQVGVEPSVVVPTAYGPLVRALARGASRGDLDRLAHQDGLAAAALTGLLDALAQARLLQATGSPTRRAVRLVGAGPLAGATAESLVRAGVDRLYLAELPRQDRNGEPPADRRRSNRADRLDRVDLLTTGLHALGPRVRVRRSRHFVKPEGDAVALTVVVADGPEPDRLVTDLLREHAAPHLLVRCSGDEAVVGPLVVPGATSCVRCGDLARRDADPRWPWLLAQLVRLEIAPSPTLAAWAAVTATVQTLAFLDRGSAETVGHTLELGTAEHRLHLRAWSTHPECPCRWDAAPVSASSA